MKKLKGKVAPPARKAPGFPPKIDSKAKVGVPSGQLGGTTDLVTPTAGKAEKGAGTRGGRTAVRKGMKPKNC